MSPVDAPSFDPVDATWVCTQCLEKLSRPYSGFLCFVQFLQPCPTYIELKVCDTSREFSGAGPLRLGSLAKA